MNYKHFSIEERCCLREYYKKGLSYRKIAELMGRNVSSISRELRRSCTHMYEIPTYYPHTAQKKYLLRHSYCHRGMLKKPALLTEIKEKLEKHGHLVNYFRLASCEQAPVGFSRKCATQGSPVVVSQSNLVKTRFLGRLPLLIVRFVCHWQRSQMSPNSKCDCILKMGR